MMDRLVTCLACLLLCTPPFAFALELGAIDVRSARYEPLDARIPLHDLRSGEFDGLKVALATSDQFELAGVARPGVLDLLSFSVVRQEEGGSYVQVRTAQPIIEQSLTFLVEVGGARERTVRTYSLDLHPAAAPAAAPSAPAGTTRAPQSGSADPEALPDSPPPAVERTAYGPVRRADTLWSIAAAVRPDDSVGVHRMMLALLEANPDAFATGNVNGLYAGAILRIPAREELGPGGHAAVAEVRRQQAEWEQRAASRRASPSASTTAPASPEAELEPGGRIEIVSAETTGGAVPQDGDTVAQALRRDLALAREETDALQRRHDEIEQRLAEAEDHIGELNRLLELKNQEIAALQTELRARAGTGTAAMQVETQPQPESPPLESVPATASPDIEAEPEPAPLVIAANREPMVANFEAAAEPAPEPAEAQPPPIPAPQEPEPPTLTAAEGQPQSSMAQTESTQQPAVAAVQARPEPASAEPERVSLLPVTLEAAMGNPVYVAGSVAVLLMVLGVAALRRRRRASAAAGAAPDSVGESRDSYSDEGNMLAQLEAVTAGLEDESESPPHGRAQARSASRRTGPAAAAQAHGAVPRSRLEVLDDAQFAELSRHAPETGQDPLDMLAANQAADAIEPGLGALADGHDDSEPLDDETSDSIAISDFADEGTDATTEAADGTSHDLERMFRHHDDTAADAEAREAIRALGAEAAIDSDRKREPAAAAGQDDAVPPRSDTPGADTRDGASAVAARGQVERGQGSGDGSGGTKPTLHRLLEVPLHGDETQAPSIGDVGEDEMRTKTDLAELYMHMGDSDRARRFLDAVLAGGDAEQRETARQMLARLA